MSDVQQQNANAVAETPVSEPTTATQQPETTTTTTDATHDLPIADAMAKPAGSEPKSETPITDSIVASPEHKDAIAEEKKDAAVAAPTEKHIEPITEGQLALKGPGLLK
jgi:hypothetical protein